jgi:hypothetical protein
MHHARLSRLLAQVDDAYAQYEPGIAHALSGAQFAGLLQANDTLRRDADAQRRAIRATEVHSGSSRAHLRRRKARSTMARIVGRVQVAGRRAGRLAERRLLGQPSCATPARERNAHDVLRAVLDSIPVVFVRTAPPVPRGQRGADADARAAMHRSSAPVTDFFPADRDDAVLAAGGRGARERCDRDPRGTGHARRFASLDLTTRRARTAGRTHDRRGNGHRHRRTEARRIELEQARDDRKCEPGQADSSPT